MPATPKIKDLLYEIGRLKKELAGAKASKLYGLVWEDKPELFDKETENALPVLINKGGKFKDVEIDPSNGHNVLIEGDNYHTLSVLSYTHKKSVDLIYIDPPYNTGAKNWKYNNDYVEKDDVYRHSKWLSFMRHRLLLARDLLKEDGVLICAIDDNEQAHLAVLLEEIFNAFELHTVTIVHNPKGVQGNNFSYVHEYAIFVLPSGKVVGDRHLNEEEMYISDLRNWGNESLRTDAKNCFYPIIVADDKIVGFGEVADNKYHPSSANEIKGNETYIWPIDGKGIERKWRYARQSVESIRDILRIKKSKKGLLEILIAKDYGTYKTVWDDKRYDAGEYGTKLLREIIPGCDFDFPKSLYTVYDCIYAIVGNRPDALVLDFFAGSGTTGHAVLEINKFDNGKRSFILCSNNENGICEEVTYERMKRVMKGYTTPSGNKIDGLGGNLKYLKTAFVPKHVEYGLTDEARLDLTRRANLLLALKENTFTKEELADSYEIFSSPMRVTGVYFSEDKSELDAMLKSLKKHAKDRVVSVYIFSWEKGAYKSGFEDYPGFHFEDIPEPILDVYRSIGY